MYNSALLHFGRFGDDNKLKASKLGNDIVHEIDLPEGCTLSKNVIDVTDGEENYAFGVILLDLQYKLLARDSKLHVDALLTLDDKPQLVMRVDQYGIKMHSIYHKYPDNTEGYYPVNKAWTPEYIPDKYLAMVEGDLMPSEIKSGIDEENERIYDDDFWNDAYEK